VGLGDKRVLADTMGYVPDLEFPGVVYVAFYGKVIQCESVVDVGLTLVDRSMERDADSDCVCCH
jgi:hypothetical protein